MTADAARPVRPWPLAKILFAAFVLLTALSFFVPFKPHSPSVGLDSSWTFAINQALRQNLVFGRDFVFTFGPFGYVFTQAFTPSEGLAIYAACTYVAVAYAAAILLLARRSAGWVVAMLLALGLLHLSMDGLLFSYPFFVGLICAEAVSRKESLTGHRAGDLAVLVFLFSVVGFLPLVKGTLVVFCGGVVAMTVVYLLANRRISWAVAAAAASTISLAGFWMASGQPLGALKDYFTSMAQIISGYTDAMSVKGNEVEVLMYVVAALFVGVSLVLSDRRATTRNLFVLALFGLFLFMSFKASFVRHDSHVLAGVTALVVSVCMLRILGQGAYMWTAAAFSALAIAAMYVGCYYLLEPDTALFSNYRHVVRRFWHSPTADYRTSLAAVRKQVPLAARPGVSDIYSYDQNDLFASANGWSPRPVAQSYSAYTPRLAEMDARHLSSPSAPDNIFLSLDAIDNRLPTLEDGPSLAVMLLNDHPVGFDNKFLVLAKNPVVQAWSPGAPASAQFAELGQTATLPDLPAPIYVQIGMRRSTRGKLEELFYKPSQLSLTVNLSTGEQKTYRFVPGEAAAGFILSPLVSSASDFRALYDSASMQWLPRVQSFKIEAVDPAMKSWAPQYAIRYYTLPIKRPPAGGKISIVRSEDCEGHIDGIDLPSSGARFVRVHGWAAHGAPASGALHEVYVVLTKGGEERFFPAGVMVRPDVSEAKHKADLVDSGFDGRIDPTGLAGKYEVGIAYREAGEQAVLCRSLTGAVEFPAGGS